MSFSGSKSDSYVLRKILKRKGYNGVDNSQFHDAWVHQGAEIKVAGEKSSLNCNSGLVLPLQDFCDVEIKVGPETFKAHRYYRIPKKSPVNNSASYMFFLHVKYCSLFSTIKILDVFILFKLEHA